MDIKKLDLEFQNRTEVDVVRLLTCNFDLGSFSIVEKKLTPTLGRALRSAIKFRTHLSMEPTTFDGFMSKMTFLESHGNSEFKGSATKFCGYAGELLTKSKTMLGTVDELVSFNEYSYVLKMYPWWIRAVNKTFGPYIDQYVNDTAFFCLKNFDLSILAKKEDVESVSETLIKMKNGEKFKVVRVD